MAIGVMRRIFSVEERERWLARVYALYTRMDSADRSYKVNCCGLRLKVLPGVYSPNFFTDSAWFGSVLPQVVGSARLLEVGCGTGVISLACGRAGASVVTTDINPTAVKNARLNSELTGISIDVREGDVFSAIRDEQFDFVFWAHPFNNDGEADVSMLLRSGFDLNYGALERYVQGANRYLTSEGRLLLGTGDSADLLAIEDIGHRHGYEAKVLMSTQMNLGEGMAEIVYYLLVELVK